MLTKGDKILIALIIVSAVLIFTGFQMYTFGGERTYAVIEINGRLFQKISLGKGGPILQLKVPGIMGESIVEINRDKVRMLYSPCPDKDCMHQGWISRPGQMIVCLPNRVVIKIQSESTPNDQLDGVSF
ncbi:MAG: hypothetical protein PWQ97_154 [Tepidanaerobacteraceae bacterium]|nr:hypothetical protein [Tepidanaerobacteraceae bacterium]